MHNLLEMEAGEFVGHIMFLLLFLRSIVSDNKNGGSSMVQNSTRCKAEAHGSVFLRNKAV